MTAAEKDRVLKAWRRFIKGGLKWTQFTQAIYDHLIQHASFIAHFNRAGFYNTYFRTGDDRLRFLNMFLTGTSCEYGDSHWLHGEYADINAALCAVVKDFHADLAAHAKAMQREQDVAEATRLLGKHGLNVEA
jgi:hypothetical protein